MPEQRSSDLADRDRQMDVAILALLVNPTEQRLWAIDEVEREIGEGAVDSLDRLYGAGLVHRLDRFVWATRAAIQAEELWL
jgi:hypothetical protein